MKTFGAGGLADAIMETCVWSILRISLMNGDGEMQVVTF